MQHCINYLARVSVMRIQWFLILLLISAYTNAATYYVDATKVSDNNTGLSDKQAWKTLTKFNNIVLETGSDVYFKCGETWKGQLNVRWAGTPSDRAIIGAYHMPGDKEVLTCLTSASKPVFSGGYVTAENIGNIPRLLYSGLIEIRASYVTVRDLHLKNSSGDGITIQKGKNVYSIVEDNIFTKMTGAFVRAYSDYAMIRNNRGSKCVWSEFDKIKPYATHPVCLAIIDSDYSVIENNVITQLYGEAIGSVRGNYNIIRNNVISNGKYVGIYSNGGLGTVIENNIIVGDGDKKPNSAGIAVSVETNAADYHDTGNIIRNNLISGVSKCFYSGMFPAAKNNNRRTGGKFIGNTCVSVGIAIAFPQDAVFYSSWEIANNIFGDIRDGDLSCLRPAVDRDIRFHHNHWAVKPRVRPRHDCGGDGDVYGEPSFVTRTSFWNFSGTNLPTAEAYRLASGSGSIDAGSPMTDTVLMPGNYPLYTSLTQCSPFDFEALGLDYKCTPRDSTQPDIGGLEFSNTNISRSISPINQAPTITTIDSQTVTEGDLLVVSVGAQDADGPSPIKLSQTNSLPGEPDIISDFGNGIGELYWQSSVGDAANSPYYVTVEAKDGAGATRSQRVRVDVTSRNGCCVTDGSLSGSLAPAPSRVDLTFPGISDWVHWGLNSALDLNRKRTEQSQISDFTSINDAAAPRGTNALTMYSWSDGMDTSTVSNTESGVRVYHISRGFEFTVPAGTVQQSLKIYVGAKNAGGRFEASLSDGSASAYVTEVKHLSDVISRVITLQFQAASVGEELTVRYILESKPGRTGWISLEAAVLEK